MKWKNKWKRPEYVMCTTCDYLCYISDDECFCSRSSRQVKDPTIENPGKKRFCKTYFPAKIKAN